MNNDADVGSKVFIVDDNPANTLMLMQVLETESFEAVSVFHDSQEALAQFKLQKPNLILLDLVMPKLSGIEFLRHIQPQIKNVEVAVIVLTASHNKQMRIEALSLGAQDYIEKPFNIIETLQRIKNVEYLQQRKTRFEQLSEDLECKLTQIRDDLTDVMKTLNAVFNNSSEYVFITSGNGDIVECNQAVQKRFNIAPEDQLNLLTWMEFDSWDELKKESQFIFTDNLKRRTYLDGSVTSITIKENQHNICIFKDITYQKEDESNLRFLTETHYITHLPNRHQLRQSVLTKCKSLKEDDRLSFIFLSFFDNAKEVELHGHQRSESLLLNIALMLVEASADAGTVLIHWGDNDFLMIEEHTLADKLVEKIQHDFNKPLLINDMNDARVYSRPTIGVYCSDEINTLEENNFDSLVHNALLATYEGARYDRRLTIFDRCLHDKISYQARIEKELIKAIEQQSFKVAYQPKVNLKNGEVIGVEALVRWYHDELGMIRPDIFIPIAENAGLINEIGALVLSKVVVDIPMLRIKYINLAHVAVNVAAPQLDNHFVTMLQNLCLVHGEHLARFIELEITETSFLDDFERVNPILRQIKTMGFRLAIDDFGTGYSSLSYLHELPIDTLKIDRSFVLPILESKKSLLMVKSIISMSLSLGLEVVAEGIEDDATGKLLSELGVQTGQGFFYHKPAFLH